MQVTNLKSLIDNERCTYVWWQKTKHLSHILQWIWALVGLKFSTNTSGQSYKASTLVNYDSRVVIYDRRGFIRLASAEGSFTLKFTPCTCSSLVSAEIWKVRQLKSCKLFIAVTKHLNLFLLDRHQTVHVVNFAILATN